MALRGEGEGEETMTLPRWGKGNPGGGGGGRRSRGSRAGGTSIRTWVSTGGIRHVVCLVGKHDCFF